MAITPEHLCRVLKGMEKQGLVMRDKGVLLVTDPAGLLEKQVSETPSAAINPKTRPVVKLL